MKPYDIYSTDYINEEKMFLKNLQCANVLDRNLFLESVECYKIKYSLSLKLKCFCNLCLKPYY